MATHSFWTDRLSDHLDGHLSAEGARAVDEHLAVCSGCRAVADELGEVRRRARALEGMTPPRDLWPTIRERLDTAAVDLTLRLDPPPNAAGHVSAAGRRSSRVGRGALKVAAVAALMLGAGTSGWLLRDASGDRRPPVEGIETAQVEEVPPELDGIADLERLLAADPGGLDANTVRVLRKNLAVIRAAVAESRNALDVDPDNAWVRRHLAGTLARQRTFVMQARELLSADD